jgi:uncharacterized protein (TIGR03118 family)
MMTSSIIQRATQFVFAALAFALSAPILADDNGGQGGPGNYQVTNLVADVPGVAPVTDPNLVNAWGITMRATSPMWVSGNGSGKSTVDNGLGTVLSPPSPVTIPAASGAGMGVPTGIVGNPSTADFLLAGAGTAASFIWATEDGAIAAWNGGSTATIKFTASDGAVYKGLALAGDGTTFRLYAADFVNGKIDVLTSAFAKTTVPGGFSDPSIPAGFAPFNIMNLLGNLYVAYAQREPGGHDEVDGPGLGFVDVFDADGFLIARAASRGKLNAPWGMAIAPAGFGKFSNQLLVGNFGDGTINAYDLKNYTFSGQLRGPNGGKVLVIDGLWGITFGNGFQHQPTDALFFAAGPGGENHGLLGRIDPAP